MVVHLARGLDRDRFDVASLSLYAPLGTSLEETLNQSGIPLWFTDKKPGFDKRVFTRIDRIVRDFRPHVVHTHLYVLFYTLIPALYRRVPAMIHTVHNVAEKEADLRGRCVNRLALRCGVVPVAIARAVADSLHETYGIDEFPLIPNGIPVELYRRPRMGRKAWRQRAGFDPEDVLFVCVARLNFQKNHALLIESFAQGPMANPRAHLLLVGDGELRPQLEKQVNTLSLRDRVHFMGLRTDIPDLLNAADVFVLSSLYEGNPLSVMEAMAGGKPVISTAVGGVPELIEDRKSGFLVPSGDAKAFAQAMNKLLGSVETRETMAQASLKRAKDRFDLGSMVRSYEELYGAILGRPSAG